MSITRGWDDGTYRAEWPHDGWTERVSTLFPRRGESLAAFVERGIAAAREGGHSVVKWDVFAPASLYAPAMEIMEKALGRLDWPVSWMDGRGCSSGEAEGIAGMVIHSVSGVEVETIRCAGAPLARVYDAEDVRWCMAGGILPADAGAAPERQAASVFERMEAVLRDAGMDMKDLLRTWFYNDSICRWYAGFNEVRTRFYRETRGGDGVFPASTGIGAVNPFGAALQAQAVAARGGEERGRFLVEGVPSPLQCAPFSYGSAFSRALEVTYGSVRLLYVSGTAAVGPDGRTRHEGDVESQMRLTAEVVEAILLSRGMGFEHVSRAVAYVKREEDASKIDAFLDRAGGGEIPLVVTRSEICRENLLFEVELDAVVERKE